MMRLLLFHSKTGLIIIINFYLLLFSRFSHVSMSTIRNFSHEIRLTHQPDVVVIGAGASGIAAVSELVRAGFKNVTLLEAEDRIGGRIYSKQLFDEEIVDLGAEFYEGLKEDAVWKMAQPHQQKKEKLLEQPSEKFKLYHAHGDMVHESMRVTLSQFLNDFQNQGCEEFKSVGECFDKKYEALINSSVDPAYIDFLKRSRIWSRSMLHLFSMAPDLYNWGLGTHPVKGPLWAWRNHGYRVVLDIMLGRWPDPEKCILRDNQKLLKKEVTKIVNWREDGGKIIVKCADKSVYLADYVICTMSVGVLQATQAKLFDPVLPEKKQEAIQRTGFGPLLKIILRFRDNVTLNGSMGVVWEPNEFSEPIEGKDLHWLQWLSFMIRGENNNHTLICFYTGPGVDVIERLPDEVIMTGQRYLAEKVLKPQSVVTDFPQQFVRTSWMSNPHFRGVNSYKTVWGDFQKELAAPLPSEDNPRLMFAGEATHPEYYTTVHGAVETGLNQAWRLIDMYRNKTEEPLL